MGRLPQELPAEVLARFEGNLPRYTSYPTAPAWKNVTAGDVPALWRGAQADLPVSLYVHIPFCRAQCWYCGCNQEVSRNQARMESYAEQLCAELVTHARRVGTGRRVVQVHFGGGTPTQMPLPALLRVVQTIRREFTLAPDAEVAIEVHPGVTTLEHVSELGKLGFNRLSMGVQDFDPRVQEAVHRTQTYEQTATLVEAARAQGYRGINVDLMYGLPHQDTVNFARTVEQVLQLQPDRVALFGYAHVPWMKTHQKLMQVEALPTPALRWQLFARTLESMVDAGYLHVGMDHFARAGDDMAEASRRGALRRNFMGYTVMPPSVMLAAGCSAISDVGSAYLQNDRDTDSYMARVQRGETPVVRGMELTAEDRLRQDVIQALFCSADVDLAEVTRAHGVDARTHFSSELRRVGALAADGLLTLDGTRIHITTMGQVLLRQVASIFDAYLPARPTAGETPRYSQAV